MEQIQEIDKITKQLLLVIAVIITVGLVMIYSSSFILSTELYQNSYHYILRQLIYLGMGISVAVVVSKTKYSFWYRYGYYINIAATLIVALTIVKGLGNNVKGASRWLSLWGFSIQPGELVKFTIILSALFFFEQWHSMETKQRLKHGLSLLFPVVLLIKQPDFGSFSICFIVVSFVGFMSSFPRKYFYITLVVGLISGVVILFSQAYRIKRLLTYLDPWKNPQGSGFQIIQSYMAFANGSFMGKGLGNSNEKLFYLPEAHNDFIFSVVGEELGFVGVLVVILLFVAMIYFGFKLVLKLNDRIAVILGSAIVFVLGIQALLNMGVVLGLLPTKGLNLPFISYGGSSLICNFFGVGLLLSAVKGSKESLLLKDKKENTWQGA